LQDVFNFTRPETALLCVLLLRGAQTPGELRGRTERLYHFDDLTDVQAALQKLMSREPALVKVLPRQPGTKESRYIHLMSGDEGGPAANEARSPGVGRVTADDSDVDGSASGSTGRDAAESVWIARLESEVAALRQEVAELKHQLAQFRKQFE
jgi:hypothetical protein